MPLRLVADPAQDNLLHLHGRPPLCGKNGAAGNPTAGSAGPLCASFIGALGHMVDCVSHQTGQCVDVGCRHVAGTMPHQSQKVLLYCVSL